MLFFLTRHTYWLCGPGEKVLERIIVLPLTKGVCGGFDGLLSFGRTTTDDCVKLSVLVSLSTWEGKEKEEKLQCGLLYQSTTSLKEQQFKGQIKSLTVKFNTMHKTLEKR